MTAQLIFRVHCSTEFHQMVKIVGNTSSLGNWNPQYGFKLFTNDESYPMWYCDYALDVEPYQIIEFKIVITDVDGYNCFWESESNRHIQILSQKQIVVLKYNESKMMVHQLKSFFSNQDFQVHSQQRPRKISVQLINELFDSEDDSEKDSDTDDNSIINEEPLSLNSNENIQISPSEN